MKSLNDNQNSEPKKIEELSIEECKKAIEDILDKKKRVEEFCKVLNSDNEYSKKISEFSDLFQELSSKKQNFNRYIDVVKSLMNGELETKQKTLESTKKSLTEAENKISSINTQINKLKKEKEKKENLLACFEKLQQLERDKSAIEDGFDKISFPRQNLVYKDKKTEIEQYIKNIVDSYYKKQSLLSSFKNLLKNNNNQPTALDLIEWMMDEKNKTDATKNVSKINNINIKESMYYIINAGRVIHKFIKNYAEQYIELKKVNKNIEKTKKSITGKTKTEIENELLKIEESISEQKNLLAEQEKEKKKFEEEQKSAIEALEKQKKDYKDNSNFLVEVEKKKRSEIYRQYKCFCSGINRFFR